MSQRIPEEKIEEVRRASDIVDVISDYVSLKKQGKNFSGLCPFHGERTPSFSVSSDKQLYHCFGCGAGGNVFSFVMEADGLSFTETVEKLALRNNISLPEQAPPTEQEQQSQTRLNTWQQAHELAAKYYHHMLLTADESKEARAYLRKRGFTKEMIDTFQIGYAPDSWEFLAPFLEKRGFDLAEIETSGLIGRRESDGKPFDRFRDRIMFPIWDKRGKVIAFGGRILHEGQPKYMNSPESDMFNKSDSLYYFHQARPAIRKRNEAVLFEGYVDVISAWRAGIDNGIAALGTALTPAHAKMIRRNADRVVVCYDADDAGMNAAYKNAETLQSAGLEVFIANLPEGYDPDDYIQTHGRERFVQDVIDGKLTWMNFLSFYYRRGRQLSVESDRLGYIDDMLNEIAKRKGAVEQDFYLRKLAEEFSLSLESLKQEVKQMQKAGQKKQDRQVRREQHQQNAQQLKQMIKADEWAERELIAHMIQSKQITEEVQRLLGGSFQFDVYQAIAAHIYQFFGNRNSPDPAAFLETIEDDELKKTASALAMKEVNPDLSEQELADYINEIKKSTKREQINQLTAQQKSAIAENNHAAAARIGQQITQLKQEMKYRHEP